MVKLKNVNTDKKQKTLSETWSSQKSENAVTKKECLKVARFNTNMTNEENSTSDNDFIDSSQSACESKLKQQIKRNLFNTSNALLAKEVIDSINSSIDMTQDQSDFIADSELKNFERSTTRRNTLRCKKKIEKNSSNQSRWKIRLDDKKITKQKLQNVNCNSADDLNITKGLLMKLKSLKVKLQHEVPPQHRDENLSTSKFLTPEEVAVFESYGPLKKGPYTKKEDDTLKKNWQTFCEVHDWDPNIVKPFLHLRHGKVYYIPKLSNRKNFMRFLANGLPWRSLYSVHWRFRNLFGDSLKKGPFSSKEDKLILSHINSKESNFKFAELAKKLKRKRHSIWQRYQVLKKLNNFSKSSIELDKNEVLKARNKDNGEIYSDDSDDYHSNQDNYEVELTDNEECQRLMNTNMDDSEYENSDHDHDTISKKAFPVVWNSETVRKFINCLLDITLCTKILELKNKIFDESVWCKVQEKMNIDKLKLKKFWLYQLHMQLFCPEVIHLNDIKIKLITLLYEKEFFCFQDIDWSHLSSSFEGLTSVFLSKLFDNLMQYAKNKINSSKSKDILNYLYDNHISELKNNSIDVVLPKLYYKCNRIICLENGVGNKIPVKKCHNPLSDEEI